MTTNEGTNYGLKATFGLKVSDEVLSAVRASLQGAFVDLRDADGDELIWTNEEAVDLLADMRDHGVDVVAVNDYDRLRAIEEAARRYIEADSAYKGGPVEALASAKAALREALR